MEPEREFIEWRGSQTHHGTTPKMNDTKITVEGQARDLLLNNLRDRRGTVSVEYGPRKANFPDREHGYIYIWTGKDRDQVKFSNEHSDTDGRRNKWTGTVTVDLSSEFRVRQV
ncbi:hypothetical protein TrVGV298_002285 [Trichoderma virens]|nr:hypothetical protein TrVGV298_002285 [Trichoderma virens]UKZ74600.1 hypothetical protein TrVFT333_002270 [Trichoderma virens FT-333]